MRSFKLVPRDKTEEALGGGKREGEGREGRMRMENIMKLYVFKHRLAFAIGTRGSSIVRNADSIGFLHVAAFAEVCTRENACAAAGILRGPAGERAT